MIIEMRARNSGIQIRNTVLGSEYYPSFYSALLIFIWLLFIRHQAMTSTLAALIAPIAIQISHSHSHYRTFIVVTSCFIQFYFRKTAFQFNSDASQESAHISIQYHKVNYVKIDLNLVQPKPPAPHTNCEIYWYFMIHIKYTYRYTIRL